MDNASDAVLIAFGVVILTTLGNTLLEWFRQAHSRRSEAVAMRRALIEELRSFKESSDVNYERSSEPEPGGSFVIPVTETYPIYEASIEKLGLLRPAEVSAVVRAYANLRARAETLAVIGTFHRTESPVLHAIVDAKWASVLASNDKDT